MCLADWYARLPAEPSDADVQMVVSELTTEEVAGLLFALVQARAFSKLLMALGLEPAPGTMPVRSIS